MESENEDTAQRPTSGVDGQAAEGSQAEAKAHRVHALMILAAAVAVNLTPLGGESL